MGNLECVSAVLTYDEHLRFIDWLEFYKGLGVVLANDLTMIGPNMPEMYAAAVGYLREWREWRNNKGGCDE